MKETCNQWTEMEDENVIVEDNLCKKLDNISAVPSNGEFQALLQCPICYNLPLKDIPICVNGHSVCGDCKSKLRKCPICKAEFSDIRCVALENLVHATSFDCPYKDQGCENTILGRHFGVHSKNCKYRDIYCTEVQGDSFCQEQRIRYTNYESHLINDHQIVTATGKTTEIYKLLNLPVTGSIIRSVHLYKRFGYRFVIKCTNTKSCFYWWISSYPPVPEGTFKAKFSLCNKIGSSARPSKKRKISATIPVVGVQDIINRKSPGAAVFLIADLLEYYKVRKNSKFLSWMTRINIQRTF